MHPIRCWKLVRHFLEDGYAGLHASIISNSVPITPTPSREYEQTAQDLTGEDVRGDRPFQKFILYEKNYAFVFSSCNDHMNELTELINYYIFGLHRKKFVHLPDVNMK